MKHASRPVTPFVITGLILLGLLIGAGCHQAASPQVRPAVWNERLVVTLEAQAEQGPGFLSLNNPDAGSAKQVRSGEATTGYSSVVAAMQGTPSLRTIAFELPGGLPSTYYLNLSIPVFGAIYVGSTGTQTATADAMELRVIVRSGDTIIGGEQLTYNAVAANKMGRWMAVPLNFRAEVAALEAGKPLTVEVVRVSGLTDFIISTDGAGSQSFLEFRYFTGNPLSGTVYLEGNKFSSSGGEMLSSDEFERRLQAFKASGGWDAAPEGYVHLPETTPAASGANALAFVAFGALLSLGLVLPRRPPIKPTLAVLLVLCLVIAGCMGGTKNGLQAGPTDDDVPKATLNQTIEPRPELEEFGTGAVEGLVHDEVGIPIRGAHVAFLGTNLFGKTDAKGKFAFQNVSAGSYVIRVDAEKYAPLEREVQIEIGSITRLDITLVFPVVKQQNDKAHLHDSWLGQTTALFAQDSFLPPSQVYTVSQSTGSTWYCDGFYDRNQAAKNRLGCEFAIPITMTGRNIFPGTSRVEVTLQWSGANAPKEMGLRVLTTTNKSVDQIYMPRAPGKPINVAIFPNEADPGHQKYSTWQFFVVLPVTDTYYPAGPLYYQGGPISYTITLHKGVVPYEPAHRDFWQGQSELPLVFQFNPLGGQGGGCYPRNTAGTTNAWILAKGHFIPPGTKEIRGTFLWTSPGMEALSSATTQWKLAYLTAVGPWTESPFQRAELTANGTNNYNFKIVPKPEETDQFYQVASNWLWSPDDNNAPRAGNNCVSTTAGYPTNIRWTIYASAVKDPNFKDAE